MVLKSPTNSSWTTVKQIFEVRGLPYFDLEGKPNSLHVLWKRWIYVLGPFHSGKNLHVVVDYYSSHHAFNHVSEYDRSSNANLYTVWIPIQPYVRHRPSVCVRGI